MMDTDSTNGSRGQDGPRSRKRGAASLGKSESAAEKKRTQNRISQQCAREKQSAYIRQMESLVAALKTPNDDATEQTKYDELVKAHLKLAEEKQQVEDALFRLRQKLLSVGNLATAAAAIINNSSLFADQVKLAANHVMSKSVSTSQDQMGHPLVMANQARLVSKLASIAVEVIGTLAGLEPYIYGVYFSKYMESVMRWRISNSVEDRLQIPVPFRPTPLQSATPFHPVVIDFINWPSIRDQMILYSSKLDLDAMSRDIVLNTVVELPGKRVSVNIHDVFFNHILPRVGGGRADGSNSMLHNREWIYLKVPVNPAGGMTYTGFALVQEALAAEMDCRMGQTQSPGSTRTHLRPSDEGFASRSAPYGPEMMVADALAAFGIDQPSNWKLSKDFARKYPHIDCSLV
ncbi:hypothetical protein K4K51_009340 [Colletotrichum sp. SAR 10_75]|nr:hypothetical protein K4K51_009340 [Colletotrichum sp. SAR 10_75]